MLIPPHDTGENRTRKYQFSLPEQVILLRGRGADQRRPKADGAPIGIAGEPTGRRREGHQRRWGRSRRRNGAQRPRRRRRAQASQDATQAPGPRHATRTSRLRDASGGGAANPADGACKKLPLNLPKSEVVRREETSSEGASAKARAKYLVSQRDTGDLSEIAPASPEKRAHNLDFCQISAFENARAGRKAVQAAITARSARQPARRPPAERPPRDARPARHPQREEPGQLRPGPSSFQRHAARPASGARPRRASRSRGRWGRA